MDLLEARGFSLVRHPWETARLRFFLRLMHRHDLLKKPTQILDVGSGDSWFGTQVLSQMPVGSELCCWDLNFAPEDIQKLKQRFDAKKISFVKEKPTGKFDFILMMDVLEHIEDDFLALKQIVSDNLKSQAYLLLSVPAWPRLWSGHDRYLKHWRRYAPAQGRKMIQKVGLRILQSGGLFHSLLYPRLLTKGFENLGFSTTHQGVGKWQGGPVLTRLLEGILDFDSRLLNRFLRLPGLSWWALCQNQ